MRDARPEELRPIAHCLGRAFFDDPVAEYLFPNPETRVRRYASFARFAMRILARHGSITTSDALCGAAIWQAPSPPRPSRVQMLASAATMVAYTRGAFLRAATLGELTVRSHPRFAHWYLAIIGTDPDHRGRGLGSELLRRTLRICDEAGTPAYLESSKESNVPFYRRHGFEVTGEITLPDGPTLWPMLRLPRPDARRGSAGKAVAESGPHG